MKARPTYERYDTEAFENGTFSRSKQFRARQRARQGWGTQGPVLPAAFDAPTLVNPTAVAAIRKAFTTAKTSKDAWRSYKREGRFDARQAPRASRMEQDVFKKRIGHSTTRVKAVVLIDASGSMSGVDATVEVPGAGVGVTAPASRMEAASVFGATVAKALGGVPTIDLDIFRHAASTRLHLKWVWHRGTPTSVFNGAARTSIGGGGNADGHALYAITERMLRTLKRGEHGVIMVVSDGLPSVYGNDSTMAVPSKMDGEADITYKRRIAALQSGQALIDAVAHARKNGITVIGVAIDGSNQSVYYGETGTVPFTGSWTALGSALGRVIGKELAKR